MAKRQWCFTVNNFESVEIVWPPTVTYAVWQHEVGETGTPHLQGYVEFAAVQRLSAVKKILPTAHWEPRRGTDVQARDYAMKKDDTYRAGPWEHGSFTPARQGKRTDLDNVIESVRDGLTLRELWVDHPNVMVKYSRGIKEYLSAIRPQIDAPKFALSDFKWTPVSDWSKSHIFWGPAGTGKTEFAKAHFEAPLLVSHIDTLKMFSPDVHDGIVFDDMIFLHWPRESQIHIVDVENNRAINVKHDVVSIPAGTRRIFTTNVDEGRIVKHADAALDRRCIFHHMEGPTRVG